MKFGRLTPLGPAGKINGRIFWKFRCDCGITKKISLSNVKFGASRSCGCLRKQMASARQMSHGEAVHGKESAEYTAWKAMRTRCSNPKTLCAKNYLGRGIRVVKRWGRFENFLSDMGRRPSPKHSLDRKNNDGNYSPLNCRWATRKQQNNNKRK